MSETVLYWILLVILTIGVEGSWGRGGGGGSDRQCIAKFRRKLNIISETSVFFVLDDRRLPNVPGTQGANGSQTSSENTSTRHESVTSTTTQKNEGDHFLTCSLVLTNEDNCYMYIMRISTLNGAWL